MNSRFDYISTKIGLLVTALFKFIKRFFKLVGLLFSVTYSKAFFFFFFGFFRMKGIIKGLAFPRMEIVLCRKKFYHLDFCLLHSHWQKDSLAIKGNKARQMFSGQE